MAARPPISPLYSGHYYSRDFCIIFESLQLVGAQSPNRMGSLLLAGMGLLQLGTSAQPFRVVLGLLTVLSGFEIIYAAVESSTLVAALLAAINLSLALTGAYLNKHVPRGKSVSAPFLWIFLPFIVAGLLLLLRNQKVITLIALIFTFFLTLAAWLLPIDTVMTIGSWSFKLVSSVDILGRRLVISPADLSLLALIYGSAVVWFAAASVTRISTPTKLIRIGNRRVVGRGPCC